MTLKKNDEQLFISHIAMIFNIDQTSECIYETWIVDLLQMPLTFLSVDQHLKNKKQEYKNYKPYNSWIPYETEIQHKTAVNYFYNFMDEQLTTSTREKTTKRKNKNYKWIILITKKQT